jgi:HSP20 family protein
MSDEKWAPFQAFTSLEQEMHLLLDRVGARSWVEGFGWRPDTDIYRDDSVLVVQMELPGIDPLEDLDVDVEDNVLQISGHKMQAPDVTETDRFITERRFGPFHRDVMLPGGVDPSGITAAFGNGILTIRVAWPKVPPEQAPSKRVHVSVAVHE